MAVIGREIGSGATSTVHEPCRRGYHYFLRLDIALTPASRAEQKSINPVTSDSRWSRRKEVEFHVYPKAANTRSQSSEHVLYH